MGNKVHRGFFFYLGVLLGVAVAAFLILVAIMILGGVRIFGISWFNYGQDLNLYETEFAVVENGNSTGKTIKVKDIVQDTGFKGIRLESDIHGLTVESNKGEHTDDPLFAVTVKTKVYGFTQAEKAFPDMEFFYEDKVLNIRLKGFSAFFKMGNASMVTVSVPPTLIEMIFNKYIDISADCGEGDVILGSNSKDAPLLMIGTVNIKTGSGKITVTNNFSTNYRVSSVERNSSLISENGAIEVNGIMVEDNLSIVSKGNVTFTQKVSAKKLLSIESNKYVKFTEIHAATIDYKAYYGKLVASKLVGNVSVQEETQFANMDIEEVQGTFFVRNAKNTKIDIEILNIVDSSNASSIVMDNGSFRAGTVQGNLIFETNGASLTIDNCKAFLSVLGDNAKIDITMDAQSAGKEIDINVKKADISINQLRNPINITVQDGGKINLGIAEYRSGYNSVLNIGSANLNVNMISGTEFDLSVQNAKSVTLDKNPVNKGEDDKYFINVNANGDASKIFEVTTTGEVAFLQVISL